MGTRHLIAVVKDEKYLVAQYGQWDGYPDHCGVNILNIIRNFEETQKLELIKKLENAVVLTSEIAETLDSELDEMNSIERKNYYLENYFMLNRDTSWEFISKVLERDSNKQLYINNPESEIEFAGDGLFCEFAYVIDFDKNTFETYKGFYSGLLNGEDRFKNEYESAKVEKDSKYGVKLIKEYQLDKLPNDEEYLSDVSTDE